jgi:hypothetical protein
LWQSDEICRVDKKILKKLIGTPNRPIRTNIIPKKVCLVPQKSKEEKNSTEFTTETSNLKLNSKNLNLKEEVSGLNGKSCAD